MPGKASKRNVVTAKARIISVTGQAPVVPVLIPDLHEVRAFARHLHAAAKPWQGELYGWPAEYTPERRKKPAASKMTFTPADFSIGESGIWFFSLMWERGKGKEPVEFLDDRGIVKPD